MSLNRIELFVAIEKRSMEKLTELLDAKANLENRHARGFTPLELAIQQNNLEAATLLIERGANKEATNKQGATLLSAACRAGNLKAVTFLVERGANLESRDNYGNTPLMNAAKSGKIEIIKLLINRGANLYARNNSGENLITLYDMPLSVKEYLKSLFYPKVDEEQKPLIDKLFEACKSGNMDSVREILTAHPNLVESKDERMETPLMVAIKSVENTNNAIKVVKGLIDEFKANVNADNGFTTVVQKATNVAILHAISDPLKIILEAKADPNVVDQNGSGLLYNAMDAHINVFRMLVAAGADINKNYLLHYMVTVDRCEANVAVLLEAKANLDAKNAEGNTPLLCAVKAGNFKILSQLMKSPADLLQQNNNGDTILHLAIDAIKKAGEYKKEDNIKLLNDVLVNALTKLDNKQIKTLLETKNNAGETLLYKTIQGGHSGKKGEVMRDVLEVLVPLYSKYGANANIAKSKSETSPLTTLANGASVEFGKENEFTPQLAEALIKCGVSPQPKDINKSRTWFEKTYETVERMEKQLNTTAKLAVSLGEGKAQLAQAIDAKNEAELQKQAQSTVSLIDSNTPPSPPNDNIQTENPEVTRGLRK